MSQINQSGKAQSSWTAMETGDETLHFNSLHCKPRNMREVPAPATRKKFGFFMKEHSTREIGGSYSGKCKRHCRLG